MPPGQLTLLRQELAHGHGTIGQTDLKRLGLGAQVVRSLLAEGVLLRVGRGAYVDAQRFKNADLEGRHVLRTVAIARTWPRGVLVSHTSAALMLGLPLLSLPDRVHGCRRASGQHRRSTHYTIHTGYSDASSTRVNGVQVVEPRFVVMGVAELSGRDAAVVVGDATLHRELVTTSELRAAADSRLHHPVHAVFTRAVDLMDHRTESVGESRSRLLLIALGYRPTPQVVIREPGGAFIARVDFLLEGTRVVVEFDGMTKYASADDHAAEKRRELRLQREGYTVVRLVWADLEQPARVRALIEAALEADRRRVA